MRLKLLLPVVKPAKIIRPRKCRQPGCPGTRFIPRQEVNKKIVDAEHKEVRALRYQCVQCGHTQRAYPEEVCAKQISDRVKGIVVMLYLLGLSYGAVELMLGGLGLAVSKSSVYPAVQVVAEKVPGLSKEELKERKSKTKASEVVKVFRQKKGD